MTAVISIFSGIGEFFLIAGENLVKFRGSILNTLLLSVFAIIFGMVIGVIVNIMSMTKIKAIQGIARIYISVIRGTPLLLQLFFVFYGLPQIGIYFSSFVSAVLGLAFHNGAYISEIFRGAISAVPYGQEEAARAIGMNKLQAFRHVVFPQAFKNAVPALGNQFLVSVLDSSLASVITITETMMKARQLAAATYSIFPIYFDAAVIYLAMTYILSHFLKKLEDRLKVNER